MIATSYLCSSGFVGSEFLQFESSESEGFQCTHPALEVPGDAPHEVHRCITHWLVYLYTIATTDT